MHDGAFVHTARIIRSLLDGMGMEVMKCPPNSLRGLECYISEVSSGSIEYYVSSCTSYFIRKAGDV